MREIPGGAFSAFAGGRCAPGDTVEVLPPLGHFTTAFDPDRARHYGAVVAGSGITPVLVAGRDRAGRRAGQHASPWCTATARAKTVMFAEELADLKDRYPARLHLVHVLSREPRESPLLSGRIDADRLRPAAGRAVVPGDASTSGSSAARTAWCVDARGVLAARGVPEPAVHTELFHVDDAAGAAAPAGRRSRAPAPR